MVDSISDANQHAARLRHHLERVRHHRAQINAAAHQAAADHYARTAQPHQPSGPAGTQQGGTNG